MINIALQVWDIFRSCGKEVEEALEKVTHFCDNFLFLMIEEMSSGILQCKLLFFFPFDFNPQNLFLLHSRI